jgi:hypothetical protein
MEFEELRAQSQQLLIEFLVQEVLLGTAFAEVAATERAMGNSEHGERAKEHAQKALESIGRFLPRVEDPRAKATLEESCNDLKNIISAL